MKKNQILFIITIILICYSCNSYKEVIKGSYKVNAFSIAEGEDAIIFGTVKSKEDNKPIPNAAISIADSNIGAITSGQGMFSIPITPGQYHLIFNAVGYDDLHIRKAVIEKGRSLEITVRLGTTKVYQK
ncbi:MAG TPA: carboxypeptidase-like regulatory domain-containing protein [Saprospiraceae bacterium]|nr:carboxypeptidase-like regulatory domain-containing protein [Saprospiraceae bacterium]HMQ82615.1 carboxypeptidase-like regulatory domain-containing protein [Saprospiraceae bacterium]